MLKTFKPVQTLATWRRLLDMKETVTFYPFFVHTFFLSLFASIIGPFGGFFASGFKRAFKIKDFGDIIPGHGGIMDRLLIKIPKDPKLQRPPQIRLPVPDGHLHKCLHPHIHQHPNSWEGEPISQQHTNINLSNIAISISISNINLND